MFVVARQKPATTGSSVLKGVKVITDLLKAAAWPIIVVAVLIAYHNPVRQIADQLAGKLSQAQKLSFGGLSVEIQAQALQKGGTGLARVLTDLGPKDIQKLLLSGGDTYAIVGTVSGSPDERTLPNDSEMDELARLESKGLLQFRMHGQRTSLKDFRSAFKRLPWTNPEGNPQKDTGRINFRLQSPVTQKQQGILDTEYYLTELGHNAFDSIVRAVEQELSSGQ